MDHYGVVNYGSKWEVQGKGKRAAVVDSKKDAFLFAAAPEMLEALILCRDNIRSLHAARVQDSIVGWDAWLAAVEAVIETAHKGGR